MEDAPPKFIAHHFGRREAFGKMGLEAEAYSLKETKAKMIKASQ